MKKWLAFLLCAFVLLALSCAFAETEVVAAVPSMDRITVNNRYGLAFTTAYDEDEALLTIRFSAEDTDWDKVKDYVLTHSREEYGHLAPDIWLEKPKNATKAKWWAYTGGQNDDQLYSLVQNEPATSANETCYNWRFVASCVKEGDNYTVMPVHCAAANKCVFACQWLDSRGREVAFEKLYVAVEWDSLKAVPLPGSDPVTAFPAADRVFWSADSGIVFAQAPSYDETTGLLHAVIDTDKTDWPTVIANHFSPALGNVHAMNIGFYPPEGAKAVCSTRFGGGVILNAEVLESLGNMNPMYRTYPSCEANAFRGSDFTSVYVPDGCTAIGSGAFAECLRLEEVSIPETLTDIAQDAFPEYAEITVRK